MAYTRFKRVLCTALSMLMLMLLFISAPTSSVSAAPSAISASMSSLSEASKILDIYNTAYVTGGVSHNFAENAGVYSFDEKEGALLLKKSTVDYMGGYYRFHLMSKKTAITNQSWIVITYKTNTTEKAKMKLASNGTDATVTLASDVSVSNGKYVRSTPVNLNDKSVSDIFTRLKSGTHNALIVTLSKNTTDNIYFYIKEISLFSSKEAAENYQKSGKLPDDTNEFSTNHVPGKFVLGMYNDGNITIGTNVYLPADFSPDKEYPLFIYFHNAGGGTNGDLTSYIKKFSDDEFIIYAPVCPTGQKWCTPALQNGFYDYASSKIALPMDAAIDYIYKVLFKSYNINTSRIYAGGDSLGSGATWDLLLREPDLIAGAFPVAGYCDPTQAANISEDTAIWVVHTAQDKSINVAADRAMVATLKNLGRKNIRYTEYDSSNPEHKALFEESWKRSTNWEHWAWVPAYNNHEMMDWILSYEKHSTAVQKASQFSDVKNTDSYFKAISYVNQAGLFKGMTPTTFEPNTTITRAMFVTVLGRLSGIDPNKYTTVSFSDVEAGSWYAPYVEWASQNGIVNGIGSGLYGVNEIITVEQACTILSRYAESQSAPYDTQLKLSHYSDNDKIESWAKDGMQWAISNSIYMGRGVNLNPQDKATRALVATMFYNYSLIYNR